MVLWSRRSPSCRARQACPTGQRITGSEWGWLCCFMYVVWTHLDGASDLVRVRPQHLAPFRRRGRDVPTTAGTLSPRHARLGGRATLGRGYGCSAERCVGRLAGFALRRLALRLRLHHSTRHHLSSNRVGSEPQQGSKWSLRSDCVSSSAKLKVSSDPIAKHSAPHDAWLLLAACGVARTARKNSW